MNDAGLDIAAYFERIGHGGTAAPSLGLLQELHWRHASTIPFENLDVVLGRGVDLDPASVARKLVTARRGGYCFEQNGLFLAAARQLGFAATALAARVWWAQREPGLPQRTHMALKVAVAERFYLCDVGFGGLTLPRPLRWSLDEAQPTTHETYRLTVLADGPAAGETALQSLSGEDWQTLYSFIDHPVDPADFAPANWYVSTHPTSFFRQEMIAARPFAGGRHILQQRQFTIRQRDGSETIRHLAAPADLAEVLAEGFGLAPSAADIAGLWARLSTH